MFRLLRTLMPIAALGLLLAIIGRLAATAPVFAAPNLVACNYVGDPNCAPGETPMGPMGPTSPSKPQGPTGPTNNNGCLIIGLCGVGAPQNPFGSNCLNANAQGCSSPLTNPLSSGGGPNCNGGYSVGVVQAGCGPQQQSQQQPTSSCWSSDGTYLGPLTSSDCSAKGGVSGSIPPLYPCYDSDGNSLGSTTRSDCSAKGGTTYQATSPCYNSDGNSLGTITRAACSAQNGSQFQATYPCYDRDGNSLGSVTRAACSAQNGSQFQATYPCYDGDGNSLGTITRAACSAQNGSQFQATYPCYDSDGNSAGYITRAACSAQGGSQFQVKIACLDSGGNSLGMLPRSDCTAQGGTTIAPSCYGPDGNFVGLMSNQDCTALGGQRAPAYFDCYHLPDGASLGNMTRGDCTAKGGSTEKPAPPESLLSGGGATAGRGDAVGACITGLALASGNPGGAFLTCAGIAADTPPGVNENDWLNCVVLGQKLSDAVAQSKCDASQLTLKDTVSNLRNPDSTSGGSNPSPPGDSGSHP